jgi:hypothetical protein
MEFFRSGPTLFEVESIQDPKKFPKTNLGCAEAETILDTLLLARVSTSRKCYRVSWQGSKIPRGLVIDGRYQIDWTQNGIISATDLVTKGYRDIGTYAREVEFGGPKGLDQVMVMFITL